MKASIGPPSLPRGPFLSSLFLCAQEYQTLKKNGAGDPGNPKGLDQAQIQRLGGGTMIGDAGKECGIGLGDFFVCVTDGSSLSHPFLRLGKKVRPADSHADRAKETEGANASKK